MFKILLLLSLAAISVSANGNNDRGCARTVTVVKEVVKTSYV
jgi:hypothetical protein